MAQKKKSSQRKSNSRRANAKSKTRGGTGPRRKSSRSRKSSGRKTARRNLGLSLAQKTLILGIGIIFATAILVLSLLSPNQGQLTSALAGLMWRTFGWGGLLVPIITGGIGLYLVLWGMEQPPQLPAYRLLGFGLLFVTLEAFASLALALWSNGLSNVWAVAQAQTGGGYLGGLIAYILMNAVGNMGAVFTLVVLGMIGTILVSGVTRSDLAHFLDYLFRERPPETPADVPFSERNIPINTGRSPRPASAGPVQPPLPEPSQVTAKEARPAADGPPLQPKREREAPKRKAEPAKPMAEMPTITTPIFLGGDSRRGGSWKLPVLPEMLEQGADQDTSGAIIREQVEIIEHTLESFGAPATVVEINQGPTITQFGVEPNFIETRSGKRTKVKVGKIASLADDLALALAARSIRIQAPVPGKAYVGIEVPNPAKALVSLRDVMETTPFQKIKSPLRIGLGQDVGGQPIVADLAAMPHLLIAGATGSGKSVCVNGIIACLLLQNTPDQLKLVMVDPKRVELTGYNGVPHLAAPVIVEMERVIGTLQWAMREMDNRYKMFAQIGARNILDYNKKIRGDKDRDPLPYIVIIIDELADLMMLSPEDTERGVTRLAQLARATGMHMVIATQRPSVDVVTGLIKANFPARIAFAVASGIDSRVILDGTGAERLLGQGDMLYQAPDAASPVRAQGCFVSEGELGRIIEYWRTARRFNLISAEKDAVPRSETTSPPVPPAIDKAGSSRQDNADDVDTVANVPPPTVKMR
ncbi:MAG TPA: DNA translocase FtsK 4TM domain-containing protein, partial [Anaerolineae bacterium]